MNAGPRPSISFLVCRPVQPIPGPSKQRSAASLPRCKRISPARSPRKLGESSTRSHWRRRPCSTPTSVRLTTRFSASAQNNRWLRRRSRHHLLLPEVVGIRRVRCQQRRCRLRHSHRRRSLRSVRHKHLPVLRSVPLKHQPALRSVRLRHRPVLRSVSLKHQLHIHSLRLQRRRPLCFPSRKGRWYSPCSRRCHRRRCRPR